MEPLSPTVRYRRLLLCIRPALHALPFSPWCRPLSVLLLCNTFKTSSCEVTYFLFSHPCRQPGFTSSHFLGCTCEEQEQYLNLLVLMKSATDGYTHPPKEHVLTADVVRHWARRCRGAWNLAGALIHFNCGKLWEMQVYKQKNGELLLSMDGLRQSFTLSLSLRLSASIFQNLHMLTLKRKPRTERMCEERMDNTRLLESLRLMSW